MGEYKHYIRIDTNNNIVCGFSDAFGQPHTVDICISENGGRHFEINGKINPPLVNEKGVYLYMYINEQVVEKTQEEIQQEINNLPIPPVTTSLTEKNRADIDYLSIMLGVSL